MRSSIGPAGINLTFTMFKMQVFPVLFPSDHFRLLCKPRKRASVTTDHVYAMLSVNFLDEHRKDAYSC